jgi:uncharacterized membrane protein
MTIPTQPSARIQSLDYLRGIVMILMVLDHTRFFFHETALTNNPEDLTTTTTALFMTRWVTHFCAPVFIFLTGTSAFLYEIKTGSKKALAKFLLTRGFILILLELTVFKFAWEFDYSIGHFTLLVIWAIGITMIFLAGMIFFDKRILLVLGLIIVFGHNLLDPVSFPEGTFMDALWKLLHVRGWFPLGDSSGVFVLFSVLPYFGLVLLGYSLGQFYTTEFDSFKRKSLLRWIGLGCCVLFIALRFMNVYGDPKPWSVQSNGVFTVLSFIATTKYPTSLLYLLMTIGPALVLLSYTEQISGWLNDKILIIGRTPMYFYLWHLFLIHGSAFIVGMNGHNLLTVYIATLAITVILYFLCRQYGNYKFAHPYKNWLKYL